MQQHTNMNCLDCQRGSLRDADDERRDKTLKFFAAAGMINCEISPGRARFHRFDDCCERHSPVDDDVAAARADWNKKRLAAKGGTT